MLPYMRRETRLSIDLNYSKSHRRLFAAVQPDDDVEAPDGRAVRGAGRSLTSTEVPGMS